MKIPAARVPALSSSKRVSQRCLPLARRLASTQADLGSEKMPTSPSTRFLKPKYTFPVPSFSGSVSTPVSGPASAQVDSPAPADSGPSSPSKPQPTPSHLREALGRADRYLLPVYARPPLVLSHGKGLKVWDTEGREYLDFSAGIAVNALGHGDADFVKAMTEQASKLLHASNVYHNEWAGRLAELLIELTRREGGLGFPSDSTSSTPAAASNTAGAKVFFANSGTEANEGALKFARKVGKDRASVFNSASKHELVCFHDAFHGRSLGALSVTPTSKYQTPFAPLLPGVRVGRVGDVDGLQELVHEGTCGVIVEPVQGEGGCRAAPTRWLEALRKRCDEVGAVLIFDEVQCGLYRTGTLWAHSSLPASCHPDIVTMAKPLANGYPIGAVLVRDSVAGTMTAGTHGTTFGGSPLACALGHHVLSRLSSKPFGAHVAQASARLSARLSLLPRWFPALLQPEVRGRGLLRGLAFKNEADPARVVAMARERGVLLLTAGKDAVRLVPSLTVSAGEVDACVEVLEGCLSALGSENE